MEEEKKEVLEQPTNEVEDSKKSTFVINTAIVVGILLMVIIISVLTIISKK